MIAQIGYFIMADGTKSNAAQNQPAGKKKASDAVKGKAKSGADKDVVGKGKKMAEKANKGMKTGSQSVAVPAAKPQKKGIAKP